MVGVRPLPDALGRVNKIEPVPLEELGRPRVDVVVNCSGVFRDLFINQVSSPICSLVVLVPIEPHILKKACELNWIEYIQYSDYREFQRNGCCGSGNQVHPSNQVEKCIKSGIEIFRCWVADESFGQGCEDSGRAG